MKTCIWHIHVKFRGMLAEKNNGVVISKVAAVY